MSLCKRRSGTKLLVCNHEFCNSVCFAVGKIDVGGARLMFWDLGGQEELQSLWDKYYAESHGIIYVVDSVDNERLQESKEAYGKATL